MSYRLTLAKETFKFAVTHFTIFSAEKAERLHGHNYYLRVEFDVAELDPKVGLAFDFNLVKPLIQKLCQQIDEYILIPAKSPYLKVTRSEGQVQVSFAQKTYTFPREDVIELPVVNISTEELARYFGELIKENTRHLRQIQALHTHVEESRGQGVTYSSSL